MSTPLQVRCDALVGSLRLCVDVELTAPWTVLFGASGSGKTSLLRLIAGLWRPSGASVMLRNAELAGLPPHRRSIALVAQHPALLLQRTVRGNVAFGARGEGVADEMLERFRLGPLAAKRVMHLSGGEAQRVCLARAMASRPRLLLLDESFTGLHRTLRDELLTLLREMQGEMPIVSVTHDVGEAFACADEVLRMDAGRIVARSTAADVLAAEREDLLRRLGVG